MKPGTRLEVVGEHGDWVVRLYVDNRRVAENLVDAWGWKSWHQREGAKVQAECWAKALGNIPVVVAK